MHDLCPASSNRHAQASWPLLCERVPSLVNLTRIPPNEPRPSTSRTLIPLYWSSVTSKSFLTRLAPAWFLPASKLLEPHHVASVQTVPAGTYCPCPMEACVRTANSLPCRFVRLGHASASRLHQLPSILSASSPTLLHDSSHSSLRSPCPSSSWSA